MFEQVYIFIDKDREPVFPWINPPFKMGYVVCRNYEEATTAINQFIDFNSQLWIDLDYDVDDNHTALDIIGFVNNCLYQKAYFRIHSTSEQHTKDIKKFLFKCNYCEFK